MNSLVKIKLYNKRDLPNLIKRNIFYNDFHLEGDCLYLVINSKDLKRLEIGSYKVIKYYGLLGIKEFLKKHYILILSFILSYIVLLVISNVIFDIEIVTNNSKLKEDIILELKENGIEKYKFIKSSKNLDIIINKILENNKDTIEWISIKRIGTKYLVNLTERVVIDNKQETLKNNIVASKDALIKYLVVLRGTPLKEVNELVKKGDIIISGNVLKDENVVDIVSASGKVYGEVWYTVNISVPLKHTVYEKTGEVINHIYLDLFGKKITLMGHYITNNSINTTTTLVDKPYLFFKVFKETKELYSYKDVTLTMEEAYNECLKRADKSILDKLDIDEHIIERKVLKKIEDSSKIELELFYRVYESITEKSVIEDNINN